MRRVPAAAPPKHARGEPVARGNGAISGMPGEIQFDTDEHSTRFDQALRSTSVIGFHHFISSRCSVE